MTKIRVLLLSAFVLLMAAPAAQNHVLCSGFLPENNLKIPVSVFQVGGMTQAEFNSVLDKIDAYYRPVVSARGGNLTINREWNDSTVNASAEQRGNSYVLNMFGGLARHQAMNADGFMLVACHEMGHHLGGAPKVTSWFGMNDWASNEGSADYFASLRCLRFMFPDGENSKFVTSNTIDNTVKQKCEEIYDTQAEENLCMRIGMAGSVTATLFQQLSNLPAAPRFDTPDTSSVSRTSDDHPAPQCRLDTYFQGSLCRHDMNVALSETDPRVGTCYESAGVNVGVRPHCWFKP